LVDYCFETQINLSRKYQIMAESPMRKGRAASSTTHKMKPTLELGLLWSFVPISTLKNLFSTG
jgi:hypothetical protein